MAMVENHQRLPSMGRPDARSRQVREFRVISSLKKEHECEWYSKDFPTFYPLHALSVSALGRSKLDHNALNGRGSASNSLRI